MSRDDEYEEYPDDRDDGPYRSPEELPHRSGLVLLFGIVSIVLACWSLLFFLPGLIGLPLGILAWIWGDKDLRLMDDGLIDPKGRRTTRIGFHCGIVGTVLNVFCLLGMSVLFVLWFFLRGFAGPSG